MVYNIDLCANEAIKKAEADDSVKLAKDKDNLVLASVFSMLRSDQESVNSWNVYYLNKETDELTNFEVTKDSVESKGASKRVHDQHIDPIDASKELMPSEKIISVAEDMVNKEFKYPVAKVFMTLHNNDAHDSEFWTVSFFSSNLFIFKIKIDAVDGSVFSKETKHLLNG